jgi:RND family efflux transporter MFP subunit
MRKSVILVIVAVLALAGMAVYNRSGDPPAGAGPQGAQNGRGGPGGMPAGGGPGGRGGMRTPMTVEFATVSRASVSEQILVVGNLIGEATVEVVPRVNGRLQAVHVKLGDPVRRGQLIAKVEDFEIAEQVRGAEAAYQVSQASIRQREADLKLAKTNLDRSRSLYERQLLPQQTFDDTEARYQAALAQVDLARAQFEQSKARLDELKITLSNTRILSPVNGFVGKRYLDPGAFASANSPVAAVVDISTVRLVANLVERDARRVHVGTPASVEVDAFPGETFTGKVSRVAPVFDPATRTAEMEIEVVNPGYRLKPGMYARVNLTVSTRANALTIPRNALISIDGRDGVFVAGADDGASPAQQTPNAKMITAKFQPVQTGIRDGERIEITAGVQEGLQVITTGAGAIKDGDRVLVATGGPDATGGGRRGAPARGQNNQRPQGQERAR